MYTILKKAVLAPSITQFVISAPEIAQKAQPGQFVILRINEKGERIPLTIADFDSKKGTVTIIVQEIGATTRQLCCLNEGEGIEDFVGPLGRPSEIKKLGCVVCVGGGVGIAPMYPIARSLKEKGNKLVIIIGARNKELLILEDELKCIGDELLVATDDGSYGRKGFVTDLLKEVLEQEKNVAAVWGIGPVVMMREVSKTTRPFKIRTIVSLNPIMVDGTGMCGACRVMVGGETKFACVDGPEFDGHQVDWELALQRLNMFKEEEKRALESINPGGGCRCL